MSMRTAQLRALIQYMLMVKRAKKRLQWAESMERGGGNVAGAVSQERRLPPRGPARTQRAATPAAVPRSPGRHRAAFPGTSRGTFVALAASCQGQGDSRDRLRSCTEVSATWRSPQGTRCWWLSVPGPSHLAAAPWPPASCAPPTTLLGTAGASQLQPGNYKTLQSAAGEKQELLQQLPEGPALDSQDFPGLGLARKGFIHLGGAVKTKIKFFISEREGGEGRKCLTSLLNALLEAKGLRGTWSIHGYTCGTLGVLPQILHGGAVCPGPSGPLPSGRHRGGELCGCHASPGPKASTWGSGWEKPGCCSRRAEAKIKRRSLGNLTALCQRTGGCPVLVFQAGEPNRCAVCWEARIQQV
ncbi:uncharacterized protein LOC121074790 [Cygnus olor]|uniref:uncharacterized protein LOC121074790 n=1 Tax=Cygnus olor TaxID=8869 RepID=UPI001ADE6BFC|nr:uncharacterized protein LOC121074790 [Cygnus olor]